MSKENMYWLVLFIIIVLIISLTAGITFLFRFIWQDGRSRLRRFAQNISISLISVAMICLLLELFFKLIFAQSDAFGYTLAQDNWDKRYFHRNSLGYRDIEWTPELLKGRTKIMVVGDSFVAGSGIEDPKDRFSDILGQKLGDSYAVMNTGVPGASTKDEIKYTLSYPYRPDIIIVSFYLNDIIDTARDEGMQKPPLVPTPPFLVQDSYALNFFYWRVFRLIPQAVDTYWDWLLTLYNNPEIWQVYQGELLRIHQLSGERNIQLVVVVFPNLLAVEASRPITSRVANLFREQGVPVLDVTDLVAGLDSADLVVNNIDSHPNEFVHRLVAEKLYPVVLNLQPVTRQ